MKLHLTDAIVRRLPAPKQGKTIIVDADVPGFGARVTANSARSYVLRYTTRAGRERTYTIGDATVWRTTQARDKARELRREIDDGGDPLANLADDWAISLHERIARKFASFVEQRIEPQGYLYRHYGSDGDLLYVGQTMSAWTRSAHHLTKANWREFICLIVIEPFATREEALAAEEEAIRSEYPKHNTAHNRSRHPLRELRRLRERTAGET
jgi:hypothetical protein